MKKLMATITGIFISTTAMAAASGRTDDSMFLVYMFLAICGMIIFLQMIPVFMLIAGFFKGFVQKKPAKDIL